ncbi:MAG: histidine kinase [Phenylobacterium sp.]|nr:histidine kinase [Phenylobacterium sp.]
MSSSEWPLRLVPRRSPPFWKALAVCMAAVAGAIAARALFLGLDNAAGLSASYFPAFIVAALYGGPRWGWATLAVSLVIGGFSQVPLTSSVSREALLVLYGLSGAVTVLVASTLREALLRLEEARAAQAKVQAALSASEARVRLAQDAGEVGLWDWDLATGEGHLSESVYRNLGLDPSKPADMGAMMEAVHPEDRDALRNRVDAARGGRMEPIEYRVAHADGSTRWLLSRGEMLRDETGEVVRALGVNIDITERRVAFDQVRDSEARFRVLADSAPLLMWISRADGGREFVNQAYVDFLGAGYEAALDFDWRTVLHPDDLDRILEEQAAGEGAQKLFTLEGRYRRTDGTYCWIRSVSQPRWAPSGELAGFIGIGYDITEPKQAEEDLKRINDLLAERVEEALAERDQAEMALRRAQKLEAVGQLTGGVAHDFNNLLTIIVGALDLMQRHPNDAARRERMVEAAQGAARRGERLTQQLLAFSRRQALKPERLNLDDLLKESEPLLRRAVGEAVNLSMAMTASDSVTFVDPSQFEAAVMNLVVNARDATPPGGSIRVETFRCRLKPGEVEDAPGGEYLCVAVHDTGEGMDAEVVARVFEPFFTTKETGRGTGLGLSQAYGFARQSGGAIAIDSALGKGTTVRIYLPLAEGSVERSAGAESGAATRQGPALKVLLVEDDVAVGDMVEALLGDLGHAVVRAERPAEAMKILRRKLVFDLMLTDVVMPGGKSGVDLAYEAVKLRPGLPIILSSGYTGETLSAAAEAPWPLLLKPYSAEALASMIETVAEAAAAPAA